MPFVWIYVMSNKYGIDVFSVMQCLIGAFSMLFHRKPCVYGTLSFVQKFQIGYFLLPLYKTKS